MNYSDKIFSAVLTAGIFLTVIFTPGIVRAQSDAYLAMVDSAQTAIAADELDNAEIFLRRAMDIEPSSPGNLMLLSNLGMIQFRNGKPDAALETLGNAHRMAPRAVVVLTNRAQVLVALGRDDEAYDDYSTIIALDSLNSDARFNRGMIALDRHSTEEAATDFAILKAIDPDSRNTRMAMASLCLSTGKYADAIPWFDLLIASDSEPQYYLHRAYCLMMNERLSEASADISAGLELEPDNPDLYELRAALYRLYYRHSDAEADEATARRLRKSSTH